MEGKQKKAFSGLEGLREVVGLEATTEGFRTGRHLQSWRK